jgi:hypothetical protein
MNIIIDTEEGLAVPEGKIKSTLAIIIDLINRGITPPSIGQNELVSGIRLAVRRKEIEPVTFVFGGLMFPVRASGTMINWPRGFPGDVLDDQLCQLISPEVNRVLR